MNKIVLSFCILILLIPEVPSAQKNDTILITPVAINISQLKEGRSRYLVYYQLGPNAPFSDIQIWNIEIKRELHNGEKVISVLQKWDYKDTVYHTARSISSAKDFRPIYHESWWHKKGSMAFDPGQNKAWINNREITAMDTAQMEKATYASFASSFGQYYLNWHLDLEIFSMLPYRSNTTFLVPFYEFGYDTPRSIAYTVNGTGYMAGVNGEKAGCWLLEHTSDGDKEVFWISKKTKEVLKLEQVIKNRLYRYKIKLGFVN